MMTVTYGASKPRSASNWTFNGANSTMKWENLIMTFDDVNNHLSND